MRAEQVAQLARLYSEHPSRQQGGSLGTVSRSAAATLGVEEALFSARPGDLLGPLLGASAGWLLLVHGFEEPPSHEELLPEIQRLARREVLQNLRDSVGYEILR